MSCKMHELQDLSLVDDAGYHAIILTNMRKMSGLCCRYTPITGELLLSTASGEIEIRLLVTEQPSYFLRWLGVRPHPKAGRTALPDVVHASGPFIARSPARTQMRMGFKLYDDIVLRYIEAGLLDRAWRFLLPSLSSVHAGV